ncbi:phage tail protein [Citrobacter werkmanii]|uniref:phage tail protein n=1 Tax=Citrobacter werkmanii TaxID=67827 RepID=UPI0037C95E8B
MAGPSTINSNLFKGALLQYYYERRADSEIGGKQFKLAKAAFGTSSLVTQNATSGGGWRISDIPPDFKLGNLNNKFATVNLTLSTTGSTINVTANLTDQDLADSSPHDFNTLVLLDSDDQACAVLCCQQDTLFKGKSFTAYMTIEQKVI